MRLQESELDITPCRSDCILYRIGAHFDEECCVFHVVYKCCFSCTNARIFHIQLSLLNCISDKILVQVDLFIGIRCVLIDETLIVSDAWCIL